MDIYFATNLVYNDLLQELQPLDLSYLIEEDGEIIEEEHLKFPPMYGVNVTLLRWLGNTEQIVGENNSIETLTEHINKIDKLMDKNSTIIMWDNVTYLFKHIKHRQFHIVKNTLKGNPRLAAVVEKILHKEHTNYSAKETLYMSRDIYKRIKNYQQTRRG